MFTITKQIITSFKERGSEFIGVLFPCTDESEFQSILEEMRTEHYKASHHCYAYRLGLDKVTEFSSDDGEPSGTAGLPILNALRSANITNAGLIVIRYFGGTKLGKPGLIEAYGRSAQNTIKAADLRPVISVIFYRIRYSYPEENLVRKIITDHDLMVTGQEYMEEVTLIVACPKEDENKLLKTLSRVEYQIEEFEEIRRGIMIR